MTNTIANTYGLQIYTKSLLSFSKDFGPTKNSRSKILKLSCMCAQYETVPKQPFLLVPLVYGPCQYIILKMKGKALYICLSTQQPREQNGRPNTGEQDITTKVSRTRTRMLRQ